MAENFTDTAYFVANASQYTCVTRSSSANKQCATSTTNQAVAGVLQKDVTASSTAPVSETIITSGRTFVELASGEVVVNGSKLKVVNSSGHVGPATLGVDRICGISKEGKTGPALIMIDLIQNISY